MRPALVLAAALWTAIAEHARGELRQTIVLSRHGVRGPYGLDSELPEEEEMRQYVRNKDMELPMRALDWGISDNASEVVSPKLTRHGYNVVEIMGDYFRKHVYPEFLQTAECHQTFAYADDNQRDNLTARAFLGGLHPDCRGLHPTTSETDLLFNQGQDATPDCPVCSRAMYEGIIGAKDARHLIQEHHAQIDAVSKLLDCCDASVCDSNRSEGSCDFFDIPSEWNGAYYRPWQNALSQSEYFTEWFLLQALNNMTLPSSLSFDKVLSLSRLHEAHMDLITNEVNSGSFGATLLAHLTASFEQTVTNASVPLAPGDGPHLHQTLDNKLLYYAAHDINILYVRNLLRLEWYTSGWHPHQSTPGGMLLFELHQETEFYVKLFFVTATPEQIRTGQTLDATNPPDKVPVILPTCSEEVTMANGDKDVRCRFSDFKKLMSKTLRHACVADTLRPFVDSLNDDLGDAMSHEGSSLTAAL